MLPARVIEIVLFLSEQPIMQRLSTCCLSPEQLPVVCPALKRLTGRLLIAA